jgi:CBS domain-containing protein
MTADPKFCLADDSIDKAARMMRDEDVGAVPVVEDRSSKKPIGMVTDRDIALKVVAAGRDGVKTTVRDVMSKGVVTCRCDDDYLDAVRAMARHQVRRMPVVDSTGALAGILSQADVARHGRDEQTGEMVEEISAPAGLGRSLRKITDGVTRSTSGGGGMNGLLLGAACIGAGAGIMYLLDPERGGSRRARVREQAERAYHQAERVYERAEGLLHSRERAPQNS